MRRIKDLLFDSQDTSDWGDLDTRPGHWCATRPGDQAISRLSEAIRAGGRTGGRPWGKPPAARRGSRASS
jgi:hypothetical protein